ncbi:gdsl esterase/lipase [Quercus suber]|uniref:Gdsl esterase/lipase n=1 Tax=Quercus suber TaxID=58331 RepID=A0AAW0L6A3_QUESU
MHCVHNTVSLSRGASMWLTGHSLGSAMALLVGKNMAKIGYFLETRGGGGVVGEGFKNETLKLGIRFANSVVKAGLMVSVKGRKHRKAQAYDPFVVLSPWVPYLFVNPDDPICSEYIGYFEHRKKMEEIGVRRIERLATLSNIILAKKLLWIKILEIQYSLSSIKCLNFKKKIEL